MHVQTKGIATALALPSTLGLDPTRKHLPENEETPIPLYYGFIYGTDTVEGLVDILVATLVDGRPDNNFLHKDVTFNPDGLLNGATHLVAAGGRLYITSPQGLSVVSVRGPEAPEARSGITAASFLRNPRAVAIQFQYAFVTDDEGLKIFNIADPDHPVPDARRARAAGRRAQPLPRPHVRLRRRRQGRPGHHRRGTARASAASTRCTTPRARMNDVRGRADRLDQRSRCSRWWPTARTVSASSR